MQPILEQNQGRDRNSHSPKPNRRSIPGNGSFSKPERKSPVKNATTGKKVSNINSIKKDRQKSNTIAIYKRPKANLPNKALPIF